MSALRSDSRTPGRLARGESAERASYTFALALALDAQRNGEPVVWVTPRWRSFLPSDAEACGLDLAALPVVRVADSREIVVAADVLARSGAFGLILLDLGVANPSLGVLSRLAGLARTHESVIVVLTEKSPDRPSLGSFVSLRANSHFKRRGDGSFAGSERGGRAAATIYSLIESCRRVDVDPFLYLRDVLVRVCTHPAARVHELVPANWKESFGAAVKR